MEKIRLRDHNDLIRNAKLIAERINKNPVLSTLCLANPILGLKAFGFEISDDLAEHIRHALPFPYVKSDVFGKLKKGDLKLRGVSRLSFERPGKEK